MNRLELMRRHFDNDKQLAAFLGVSMSTLYDWFRGRDKLNRAVLRLFAILEHLEDHAPELHAALVEQAKRAVAPVVPVKPALPVLSDQMKEWIRADTAEWLARTRDMRPARVLTWDDDAFWDARSVTRDEHEAGVRPDVVDSLSYLRSLTDEQEGYYCAAMFAYERRTGRVVPGREDTPVEVVPVKPALPVLSEPMRVLMRGAIWDDAYWYARTVTLREHAEGVAPVVVDSETDEQAYWDSLADYCERTGRVMPEPEVEF